jgi:hypothetical protein
MVAEDTAAILEEASGVIEDTVELLEDRVSWITQNAKATALVAGLGGIALGLAAGVFLSRKRLELKYRKIADTEIASVKEHYSIFRKEGPENDLAARAEAYRENQLAEAEKVIDREGYTAYHKVPVTVEKPVTVSELTRQAMETAEVVEEVVPAVERNVFESDEPDTYFDYDEESVRRKEFPSKPFVITKDEFDSEEENDQQSLTYYDGDDVLTDEADQPISDKEATIGFENLLRFGHGSGDPKVVYVRNPKLEVDFEVVHSDGKYAKEVLGFDDGELQHSDRRPRKFRLRDE